MRAQGSQGIPGNPRGSNKMHLAIPMLALTIELFKVSCMQSNSVPFKRDMLSLASLGKLLFLVIALNTDWHGRSIIKRADQS